MTKTIWFYKDENSRWYADIPEWVEAGGTEDDLEMVCGADLWLDELSGAANEITFTLSDTDKFSNHLNRIARDEFGATYMAYKYYNEIFNAQVWLCNVTKFVFGEFPEVIYYKEEYEYTRNK